MQLTAVIEHHTKGKAVWSVATSPDDSYIASGSSDKTVRITSTADWKLMTTISGHKSYVSVRDFFVSICATVLLVWARRP